MSEKICVIGTGYVGLVTAIGLSDFGNHIIGVDVDTVKIENLKKGISPIYEPGIEEYLLRNLKSKRLQFSNNIDDSIKKSTVIFIGVGTPSLKSGEADLSQVMSVADKIAENLNEYKIIVTKSTVPVGTNQMIIDRVKSKTNKTFDVVSNPEFLREGKAIIDFFNPDRVIIGYKSDKARKIMENVYRALRINQTPFVWCNLETAELIKYASNAFLATKITFINQIANLSEKIGADVHLVAKAMGMDGRISQKFLHPGPGYGGSCFPKDTRALVNIGKKLNVDMSLVKEVVRANENQKLFIVEKIRKCYKNNNIKTIAILGLAFKAETDDMRESPSIVVIKELLKDNLIIKANDPKSMNNAKIIFGDKIEYFENEFDAVKDADMLVILTEWNEYRNIDINRIKELMNGNIIIDTRNILDGKELKKMGFEYIATGR